MEVEFVDGLCRAPDQCLCPGHGIKVPNEGSCARFKSFQLSSEKASGLKKNALACLCLFKSITVVFGGAQHRMKQHYPCKNTVRGKLVLHVRRLNRRENEKVGAADLFRFILGWAQFSSQMNG